ncbi:hypothetical protein D3C83_02000 [compost metagenome]
MRHALACGPLEQHVRFAQRIEIDLEPFHVGNALPRRGRLGDGNRDFFDAGEASGPERIEAANAAGGNGEQRAALQRGALERFAQRIVAQGAAG